MQSQGANLSAMYLSEGIFQGYSALHISVVTDNMIACKWLLNNGVNVNILDANNETPMDKASKRQLKFYIDELRNHDGSSIFVEKATQQMHELIDDEELTEDNNSAKPEFMEKLNDCILRGADINGFNRWQNAWHGDRPLHTLLIKGNQKLITWFLNMGADLSLKDQGAEYRVPETPIEKMHRTRARFENETMAYLRQEHSDQLPKELKEDAAQPTAAAMLSANGILPAPKSAPEPVIPKKKEKSFFASFRK